MYDTIYHVIFDYNSLNRTEKGLNHVFVWLQVPDHCFVYL